MSTTSDPSDPRLTHGADAEPVPQAPVYLVLSEEERAKGFVRPVRRSYRHTGTRGPVHPLRELTAEEAERYRAFGYVAFEAYPEGSRAALGRYWTQSQLDRVGTGCGTVTTMGTALAETYAREPGFYGSTYCCGCQMHRPVGTAGEFTWLDTRDLVGT